MPPAAFRHQDAGDNCRGQHDRDRGCDDAPSGSRSWNGDALRFLQRRYHSGLCDRRLEQPAVDRLGLRRRIRPELVSEEPSAPLVHAQRLGAIAAGGVRFHQEPVSGFAKRLEGDRLLGPLRRFARIARSQARIGENAEGTCADIGEVAALLFDPRAVLSRQERLPRQ